MHPPKLVLQLSKIFDNAQVKELHQQCIKDLTAIYKQVNFSDFAEQFLALLSYPMSVFDKSVAVDNCVEFVARFAASLQEPSQIGLSADGSFTDDEPQAEQLNEVLKLLFDLFVQAHGVQDKAIRLRSCQLVSKLFQSLGDEAQIDDELYAKIMPCFMERLKDKFPRVRFHAVYALTRLQDPADTNCKVLNAFIFLMSHDPSPEVRNAVLTQIALNKLTLPVVLERRRDVTEAIRRQAYCTLAEKLTPRVMTIKQRVAVLKDGLSDPSASVRLACEKKLLAAWLKHCGSVVQLLLRLDVTSNGEVAEMVLDSLIKYKSADEFVDSLGLSESRVIDEPTCENVFFWRYMIQYLRKHTNTPQEENKALELEEAEELLDKILPPLYELVDYVKSYIKTHPAVLINIEESVFREFISLQLLAIVDMADMSDVAGRKHLIEVVQLLIEDPEVNLRLYEPLVDFIMKSFTKNFEEPIRLIAECVSDFRQPLNNETLDEVTFGSEPPAEKDDAETLIRCLTLVCNALKYPGLKVLNSTLRGLLDSLILPSIANVDPNVRNLAFRGLGLYCIMDREIAVRYFLVLLQTLRVDVEQVKKTALTAVFDLLLVFGLSLISSQDNDNATQDTLTQTQAKLQVSKHRNPADEILGLLISFLEIDDQELHSPLVEGFAKLMLHNRIYSPKLLSRLILYWFNPISKNNPKLRHCLGAFLPLFAFSSRSNQDTLEEAFLPTMQTLFDAPITNPLAKVDAVNVANFMVQLTNRKHVKCGYMSEEITDDVCAHGGLAIKICHQILSDPDADVHVNRTYARILTTLDLIGADHALLKDLNRLVEQCFKDIKDRFSKKHLSKMKEMLIPLFESTKQEDEQAEDETSKADITMNGRAVSEASSSITVQGRMDMTKGVPIAGDACVKRQRVLLKYNDTKMLENAAQAYNDAAAATSRFSSSSVSSIGSGTTSVTPKLMSPVASQGSISSVVGPSQESHQQQVTSGEVSMCNTSDVTMKPPTSHNTSKDTDDDFYSAHSSDEGSANDQSMASQEVEKEENFEEFQIDDVDETVSSNENAEPQLPVEEFDID